MAHQAVRSTLARPLFPSHAFPKKRLAVYIGRFQPFHRGHEYVLNHCLEHYDEVLVLVGSAFKARDIENPFTYEERCKVIRDWYSERREIAFETDQRIADVHCAPLRDRLYNDAAWITAVQETVANLVSNTDLEVTIVGSDRDASTWYLKAFPQWRTDIIEPYKNIPGLAATKVREHYFQPELSISSIQGLLPVTWQFLMDFTNSSDYSVLVRNFRHVKKYRAENETGKYPQQYVTADAVVIQSGHVLVIRRAQDYGHGLLALPGGFVKAGQRIKDAAVAEVMEETGILLAEGRRAEEITRDMLKGSIVDHEYFDHPKRSLRGRTFTHAFLMRLNDKKALPSVKAMPIPLEDGGNGVDLETFDVQWLDINTALEHPEWWFEDHYDILEIMYSRLKD